MGESRGVRARFVIASWFPSPLRQLAMNSTVPQALAPSTHDRKPRHGSRRVAFQRVRTTADCPNRSDRRSMPLH
jgi:hypothetical protein